MKSKKAVIVAINDYKNISNLHFTHSDAALWKATLLSIDSDFEITEIYDNQATKTNILDALRGLVNAPCPLPNGWGVKHEQHKQSRKIQEIENPPPGIPQCIRVFIFAGHGCNVLNAGAEEPDGLDEAICPYETEIEGTKYGKRNTVITDNEIVSILNGVKSPQDFYVVYDSCHSGDPGRNLATPSYNGKYRGISPSVSSSRFVRQLRGSTAPVCWLSACQPNETTPDSPSFSSIAGVLAMAPNATPQTVIQGAQATMNSKGATPVLTDAAGLGNIPIFQGKRRVFF